MLYTCDRDTVIKELSGRRAGQQREQRCFREKSMKMF